MLAANDWNMQWMKFIQSNAVYSAYCSSLSVHDITQSALIESQHAFIAQLYSLVGSLADVDLLTDTQWWSEHLHLFESHTVVTVGVRAAELQLSVQFGSDLAQAIEVVTAIVRKSFVATAVPLQLARVNAVSWVTVEKAGLVGLLRERGLSWAECVLAIKQDVGNVFGWAMTDDDREAVAAGVFKRDLRWASEVVRLKRSWEDYVALHTNVLQGRFPVFLTAMRSKRSIDLD
jgi:hypothetical protein